MSSYLEINCIFDLYMFRIYIVYSNTIRYSFSLYGKRCLFYVNTYSTNIENSFLKYTGILNKNLKLKKNYWRKQPYFEFVFKFDSNDVLLLPQLFNLWLLGIVSKLLVLGFLWLNFYTGDLMRDWFYILMEERSTKIIQWYGYIFLFLIYS